MPGSPGSFVPPWPDPIGAALPWLVAQGLPSLAGLAFLGRLLPILPSNAMLVAAGAACAQLHWRLAEAIGASVAGSLAGCICIYLCGASLEPRRVRRLHAHMRALLGIPAGRLARQQAAGRPRGALLAFASQLLPLVRLVAPLVAGTARTPAKALVAPAAAGIGVWNGLFIGAGYVVARAVGAGNLTAIVLGTPWLLLLLLLAAGSGVAWIGRWHGAAPESLHNTHRR